MFNSPNLFTQTISIMKKNQVSWWLAFALLLASLSLQSQENKSASNPQNATVESKSLNWDNISLTGEGVKLIVIKQSLKNSIGISTGFPLLNPQNKQLQYSDISNAFSKQEYAEQLLEKLDGEFMIGSLSGETATQTKLKGKSSIVPGIQYGFQLFKFLRLRASGAFFRNEWSGEFPVLVFPNEQNPSSMPTSLQGEIRGYTSGLYLQTGVSVLLAKGMIKPFVSAAVQANIPFNSKLQAFISDIAIPIEVENETVDFSPVAGAGAQINILKTGFLELEFSFARPNGAKFIPSVGASAGLRF